MALVDAHVHIYPDKIAERAVQSVSDFYGIPMRKGGQVSRLLASMAESGVTNCIVYSVANKPSQVESINDFIAQTCAEHPELVGFMTLHQDYPDPVVEIERSLSMGLKGIKLHPDSQQVDLDDERLLPIYEIAEAKRIPMVIHCGDYRYDFSHPRRMKHVLELFPKLVVDAAHFGGWSLFDYAFEILEHENCFVDTSSAQFFLGPRRTRELCEAYGTDRILFGSDFPMWSPKAELDEFSSLGFSAADFEAMTWRNAERFLGQEIR